MVRALAPGLVLMDVGMAELNGIDAARQIHAGSPDVRIVMLSMHEDRQYVFESLQGRGVGVRAQGGRVRRAAVGHPGRHGRAERTSARPWPGP